MVDCHVADNLMTEKTRNLGRWQMLKAPPPQKKYVPVIQWK